MFSMSYRFMLTCFTVALFAAGGMAAAQTEWVETGAVVATVDGVEQTTHAYDLAVTEDGVTTVTAGATFSYIEEMKMGDMVLVPASYLVTILTYDMELVKVQQGAIEFSFSVDPETLEISQPEETKIVYYPDGPNPEQYYVLTQGELKLDPIVVIDETTWRISGTIEGLVSHQAGYYPEHNPDDYFTISATFEFERVAAQDL